jgi:murein DD-endopeptidase MepM/ murein hydrolase activator NlpD
LPGGDAPDLAQPASPARVAGASRSGAGASTASQGDPAPAASPRSAVRQPAPSDALPAVNARSLGGSGASAPSTSPPAGPYTVAVAVQPGSGLDGLGQALVSTLQRDGIAAKLAALSNPGRPDVILALNDGAGARNEAWYCDPGPEQSSVLALNVLDAIGPGNAAAPAADGPRAEFPCEDVHAGRARVPAVLVELDAAADSDAETLALAVETYFRDQRSEVLAARAAPKLVWPARGPVTSHYGTSHPLGIDIGQSAGPIVAATDGIVEFAGGNACCSYGLYVVIKGPDGVGTLYGHLSSIAVRQGLRVRQGQLLGQVGCTGSCTGTHLHFEVFQANQRQDPMRYLP